jgi:SAM-dependent methyltransferase
VVAAHVEGAGATSSCGGCGDALERGEWACARCRLEAAGNGYLRMVGATTAPEGYDAALFETLAALEPTSFWFRGRNAFILWAIERWFPHTRSFLEVGCGTGFVLSAILNSRPDLEALGVELFPEGLRVARRRLEGVPLAQADAQSLGIDQAFDLVGAFDVLEHIDRDEDAMKAMFTALRPGGGFIATVPQHRWLWSGADHFAGHARRYTRRELTLRMRAAGFELLWTTSFVTLLLPVMASSRLLARRRPYSLEREFGLPRWLDRLFEQSLDLERAAIARGVSLPMGGSLLAVARRPDLTAA